MQVDLWLFLFVVREKFDIYFVCWYSIIILSQFYVLKLISNYHLRKERHLFLQDIDIEILDQLYFLNKYLRIYKDLLHKQVVRREFQ